MLTQKVRQQLLSNTKGLEMTVASAERGSCSPWEGVGCLPRQSLRGASGKTDATGHAGPVDRERLVNDGDLH